MSEQDWRDLYRDLEILGDPPAPAVGVPTDAAMTRFESDTGSKLPTSFRNFMKVFGPGELTYDFSVRGPSYRVAPDGDAERAFNRQVDLVSFNEWIREGRESIRHLVGQYTPRAIRLVYFAQNTAGDQVGWDPEDERDSANDEYGVYVVLREEQDTRYLASSFAEFVSSVCFGDGWERMLGAEPSGQAVHPEFRVFQPAWRTYEAPG